MTAKRARACVRARSQYSVDSARHYRGLLSLERVWEGGVINSSRDDLSLNMLHLCLCVGVRDQPPHTVEVSMYRLSTFTGEARSTIRSHGFHVMGKRRD